MKRGYGKMEQGGVNGVGRAGRRGVWEWTANTEGLLKSYLETYK